MHGRTPKFYRTIERVTAAPYWALFTTWVEVVIGCAIAYFLLQHFFPAHAPTIPPGQPITRLLNSLYFSLVTATTVGYGDIVPLGISKAIATMEALGSFFLFAVIVTKLASHRQEIILAEIHRHTFDVHTQLAMILPDSKEGVRKKP